MAEFDNNKELTTNSKPTTTEANATTAPYSLLGRSITMYSNSKPYLQSTSRFYNSIESMKGKVKKLCTFFDSSSSKPVKTKPNESLALVQTQPSHDSFSQSNNKLKSVMSMGHDFRRFAYGFYNCGIRLPGTEDRIVVYLTSLRGVRRTYEDCYAVRMIFRGFRVWIDERDISMDSAYKRELQKVLGEKSITLPQVFIRGYYVGGSDVIKSMFETGELAKILDGFPRRPPGIVCEACGDVRFVPCGNCSGSRKVFDEDDGVLKRCLECNENGLIRCPDCCS